MLEQFHGLQELLAINVNVRHPFNPDSNGVALDFGTKTVLIFEDANDGYRSAAATPIIYEGSLYELCDNVNYVRVPVRVEPMQAAEYADGADGIDLWDTRNDRLILRVGTDNVDDYYPTFVLDFRPEMIAGRQ